MDYVMRSEVANTFVSVGAAKAQLKIRDLLLADFFPAGIWMGAPVSYSDWWLWNQLPVTLGNLIGGFLFVGVPMLSMRTKAHMQRASPAQAISFPGAEPEPAEA